MGSKRLHCASDKTSAGHCLIISIVLFDVFIKCSFDCSMFMLIVDSVDLFVILLLMLTAVTWTLKPALILDTTST